MPFLRQMRLSCSSGAGAQLLFQSPTNGFTHGAILPSDPTFWSSFKNPTLPVSDSCPVDVQVLEVLPDDLRRNIIRVEVLNTPVAFPQRLFAASVSLADPVRTPMPVTQGTIDIERDCRWFDGSSWTRRGCIVAESGKDQAGRVNMFDCQCYQILGKDQSTFPSLESQRNTALLQSTDVAVAISHSALVATTNVRGDEFVRNIAVVILVMMVTIGVWGHVMDSRAIFSLRTTAPSPNDLLDEPKTLKDLLLRSYHSVLALFFRDPTTPFTTPQRTLTLAFHSVALLTGVVVVIGPLSLHSSFLSGCLAAALCVPLHTLIALYFRIRSLHVKLFFFCGFL